MSSLSFQLADLLSLFINYIRYVLDPDYGYNTTKPLYIVINRLIGYIEEIEGSSNKYLVVADSLRNKNIKSSLDNIIYGHLLKLKWEI